MPMEVRTRKADVTVNVTGPIANGIFSGADTFSVGSQTQVLGNTNLATGDVAGGLIAPNGESASRTPRTGDAAPREAQVRAAPSGQEVGLRRANERGYR